MSQLGIFFDEHGREAKPAFPEDHGEFDIDGDDYLLYALLTDNVYCPELLWEDPKNKQAAGAYEVRDYQYPLFRVAECFAGFACARTTGKALADDAAVLTPAGYQPITALNVGDLVIGSDGLPTPVLGVYAQGERNIWRVEFTDGAAVECDDEHLWTVTCDTWKGRGTGERTMQLRDLRDRRARFKVRLPSAPAQFLPAAEPLIDSWLLGALLGGGNLTRPTMIRFASVDEENLERFRQALPADAELIHDGGCNYRVRSREYVYAAPGQRSAGRSAHALLRLTRACGLHGLAAHEKHVPANYLWGSPEVRLAVLRGLVDTDGSVDRGGGVEISTVSAQLAADIRHLALSLGGRASVRRGSTPRRDRYRVMFRLPGENPCLLSRKVAAYVIANAGRTRDSDWRSIKSIIPAGRKSATCIEIAAADGLFMASDMVLTHNTESIKAKSFTHAFKRQREDRVLSAPELIHLLPLTDAIEDRIQAVRLTREFLDTRGGKTGLTHRPFGVDYLDGTKVIGRIPRIDGRGVKGMHAPDVTIDEGQDYPEKGWTEIHEVVLKDHVNHLGEPDFHYEFYGVHSGARDTGFYKRTTQGGFKIIQITALQRPGWNKAEKDAAKAAYGGTSSPDYRRNIYGEPGAAASPLFVSARLIACMDQDRDSDYNLHGYRYQEVRVEEFDEMMMPIGDVLDLPSGLKSVWVGMDLGLTVAPTVIMIFSEEKVKGVVRLKLVRRIHLMRMRTRQIRHALYAIAWHYGNALQGIGIDETGIGFPLFQEMEDDEAAPPGMMQKTRGYFFNSKVPVNIATEHVTRDSQGNLRDQYGTSVTEVIEPLTGQKRYVLNMPMIEASTRYLREFVDTRYLLLPFDPEVIGDMQGDTSERVKRIAGLKQKPNAFHILDAQRGMAMIRKADEVDSQLALPEQQPVLEMALDDFPDAA